jgi:Putative Ig domain
LLYFSIVINLEGDTLTYTLGRSPQGMIVNRDTGLISWMPTATQIGTQTIDVLVTDAQGAVSTQTYNLVVGNTPINQAPTISSQPKFSADVNAKYQYQVVANDPERDRLTYTLPNYGKPAARYRNPEHSSPHLKSTDADVGEWYARSPIVASVPQIN